MRGHGKGAEFERNICKRLSLWVSGRSRQDVFWRSAMSGGRATVMRRRGQQHETAGDICATHELGHVLIDLFVVETKFYRDLKLNGYFFGNKVDMRRFWIKLNKECGDTREPLLIAKQNMKGELVFTSSAGLRILRWGGNIKPHIYIPRYDMHCLFLQDMLMLKFDRIRKLHKLRKLRGVE